jgi:hypothetical protein
MKGKRFQNTARRIWRDASRPTFHSRNRGCQRSGRIPSLGRRERRELQLRRNVASRPRDRDYITSLIHVELSARAQLPQQVNSGLFPSPWHRLFGTAVRGIGSTRYHRVQRILVLPLLQECDVHHEEQGHEEARNQYEWETLHQTRVVKGAEQNRIQEIGNAKQIP